MIYDYVCNNGHKTEKHNKGTEDNYILCPICGQVSLRVPFSQSGSFRIKPDTNISQSYRDYQEASHEINYKCEKFQSETNAKVPNLGLWHDAKRKAGLNG